MLFGCELDEGNLMRSMKRRVRMLALAFQPVLERAWQERHRVGNPAAPYFDGNIIGSVDTFPIKCRRPRSSQWRTALIQGKYKVTHLRHDIVTFAVEILTSSSHAMLYEIRLSF